MTRMSAVISCQFLVFSQGTKNRARLRLSRNHLFQTRISGLIVLEPALMSRPRLARAQYSENIPRQRVTSRTINKWFSEIANFVRTQESQVHQHDRNTIDASFHAQAKRFAS